MVKRVLKILVTLLLIFPIPKFAFPQITFSDSEIDSIYTYVRTMEISDSLKTSQINLQKLEISQLKSIMFQDSIVTAYKDKQIEIVAKQRDLYKEVSESLKPKWYDNRHLWYLMGAGFTILTSYSISHFK